jgi:hypothetical protein
MIGRLIRGLYGRRVWSQVAAASQEAVSGDVHKLLGQANDPVRRFDSKPRGATDDSIARRRRNLPPRQFRACADRSYPARHVGWREQPRSAQRE